MGNYLSHFADSSSHLTCSNVAVVAAATAGLAVSLAFVRAHHRRQLYPPGPMPIPVFGNLLLVGSTRMALVANVMHMWRVYGDVFTLFFGDIPVVFLNGHAAIYEGLVKNGDKCSSRYPLSNLFVFAGATDGMIMSPHWKEQRKFALETLREHGMGKISLEDRIHEELQFLFGVLDSYGGDTCSYHQDVRRAISNVVCNIVFGHRFDYSDKEFVELILNVTELLTITPKADLTIMLPFVKAFRGKWTELEELKGPLLSRIARLVEQRRASLDGDNPCCYVDSLLLAMQQKGAAGMTCGFSEKDLISNVLLLFTGGTDTTDSTIRWALLYLLVYPDVRERLWQEIEDKIGRDRLPSVRDRQRMPYTEAFITEVLRISNPAYFTLSYQVDEPMVVRGQKIPAGAVVIGNLDSVGCDEQLYANHDLFNPDRHLDKDGNYRKPEKLLPFSIGRRSCLGESLARMEIFVFVTAIIQRYDLLPPSVGIAELPEIRHLVESSVRSPYFYECRLVKRK